jgi:hypothetical protein
MNLRHRIAAGAVGGRRRSHRRCTDRSHASPRRAHSLTALLVFGAACAAQAGCGFAFDILGGGAPPAQQVECIDPEALKVLLTAVSSGNRNVTRFLADGRQSGGCVPEPTLQALIDTASVSGDANPRLVFPASAQGVIDAR